MYSSTITNQQDNSSINIKPNLKILIDNENTESLLSQQDDKTTNKSYPNEQTSEISEEEEDEIEDAIEVDVDNNEIEFHVNLDKVPPTLQNTVLNEKIYLNDSINESNPPQNLNEISQEDLALIYDSLGLTEDSFILETSTSSFLTENSSSLNKQNLFDKKKLHLYGTDQLSTADIFEYFKDYKPIAVEWINDSSCNVIWKNDIHAANALLGMSIPYDSSIDSSVETKSNESIGNISKIISLKNRKFEMQPPKDVKWRKGVKSAKGYQIYMRYMRQTDRKQKGAESRSEYYRKYGNPNFGNIKGIISQSKRERMKNEQLTSANSDLQLETNTNASNSRRNLISYELDDYSQNNLEEFGTNKSFKNIDSHSSDKNRSREKKLRLYSDDLVNSNDDDERDENGNENDSKMRSDKIGQKRKNRFQPYESSKLIRSNRRENDDEDDDDDDGYKKKRYYDRLRDRYRFSNKPDDLRNKLNSYRKDF